ncbi:MULTISPECIES: hypothetical protein [unclassified Maridesulfovibrio]|uniref:hypothetical protein n=1 Tax=unclassified Maridesulfovibrio TaxID=2794999 RepID=UPI003B43A6A1
MKYILMVLVLILFVGGSSVSAKATDSDASNGIGKYLDLYLSTLFYKNNDTLLKWDDHITIRMIGLPEELNPFYHMYLDYFNSKLNSDGVVIEDVESGDADIMIVVSNDLTKTALSSNIKSLLKINSQSEDDYNEEVSSYKKDGIVLKYKRFEDGARFVALWDPLVYPARNKVERDPRFQMQRILYCALTFVPPTTKCNSLVVGKRVYGLNYLDASYMVSLYDKSIKSFAPISEARGKILKNMVNYLSAIRKRK